MTIYTIGHSTRELADFVGLLKQYQVNMLADIRSYPSSRRCPQYNQEAMQHWLPEHGIAYQHIAALGGRRPKGTVSLELIGGWTHPAFRNYAAYMQSDTFECGLAELIELAKSHTVAYMCSEAVWWKCHRRMVSDALTARGIEVEHIMDSSLSRHELTGFAETHGDRVVYPGQPALQLFSNQPA